VDLCALAQRMADAHRLDEDVEQLSWCNRIVPFQWPLLMRRRTAGAALRLLLWRQNGSHLPAWFNICTRSTDQMNLVPVACLQKLDKLEVPRTCWASTTRTSSASIIAKFASNRILSNPYKTFLGCCRAEAEQIRDPGGRARRRQEGDCPAPEGPAQLTLPAHRSAFCPMLTGCLPPALHTPWLSSEYEHDGLPHLTSRAARPDAN